MRFAGEREGVDEETGAEYIEFLKSPFWEQRLNRYTQEMLNRYGRFTTPPEVLLIAQTARDLLVAQYGYKPKEALRAVLHHMSLPLRTKVEGRAGQNLRRKNLALYQDAQMALEHARRIVSDNPFYERRLEQQFGMPIRDSNWRAILRMRTARDLLQMHHDFMRGEYAKSGRVLPKLTKRQATHAVLAAEGWPVKTDIGAARRTKWQKQMERLFSTATSVKDIERLRRRIYQHEDITDPEVLSVLASAEYYFRQARTEDFAQRGYSWIEAERARLMKSVPRRDRTEGDEQLLEDLENAAVIARKHDPSVNGEVGAVQVTQKPSRKLTATQRARLFNELDRLPWDSTMKNSIEWCDELPDARCTIFTAREGKKPLGWAQLQEFTRRGTGYLDTYVRPSARKKGVGSKLVERALEHARARGMATVKAVGTSGGLPLYSKHGFEGDPLMEYTIAGSGDRPLTLEEQRTNVLARIAQTLASDHPSKTKLVELQQQLHALHSAIESRQGGTYEQVKEWRRDPLIDPESWTRSETQDAAFVSAWARRGETAILSQIAQVSALPLKRKNHEIRLLQKALARVRAPKIGAAPMPFDQAMYKPSIIGADELAQHIQKKLPPGVSLSMHLTREGEDVVARCCAVARGKPHVFTLRVNTKGARDALASLGKEGVLAALDNPAAVGSIWDAVKSIASPVVKVAEGAVDVVKDIASNPIVQIAIPPAAIAVHTIDKATGGSGVITGPAGTAIDLGTAVAMGAAGGVTGALGTQLTGVVNNVTKQILGKVAEAMPTGVAAINVAANALDTVKKGDLVKLGAQALSGSLDVSTIAELGNLAKGSRDLLAVALTADFKTVLNNRAAADELGGAGPGYMVARAREAWNASDVGKSTNAAAKAAMAAAAKKPTPALIDAAFAAISASVSAGIVHSNASISAMAEDAKSRGIPASAVNDAAAQAAVGFASILRAWQDKQRQAVIDSAEAGSGNLALTDYKAVLSNKEMMNANYGGGTGAMIAIARDAWAKDSSAKKKRDVWSTQIATAIKTSTNADVQKAFQGLSDYNKYYTDFMGSKMAAQAKAAKAQAPASDTKAGAPAIDKNLAEAVLLVSDDMAAWVWAQRMKIIDAAERASLALAFNDYKAVLGNKEMVNADYGGGSGALAATPRNAWAGNAEAKAKRDGWNQAIAKAKSSPTAENLDQALQAIAEYTAYYVPFILKAMKKQADAAIAQAPKQDQQGIRDNLSRASQAVADDMSNWGYQTKIAIFDNAAKVASTMTSLAQNPPKAQALIDTVKTADAVKDAFQNIVDQARDGNKEAELNAKILARTAQMQDEIAKVIQTAEGGTPGVVVTQSGDVLCSPSGKWIRDQSAPKSQILYRGAADLPLEGHFSPVSGVGASNWRRVKRPYEPGVTPLKRQLNDCKENYDDLLSRVEDFAARLGISLQEVEPYIDVSGKPALRKRRSKDTLTVEELARLKEEAALLRKLHQLRSQISGASPDPAAVAEARSVLEQLRSAGLVAYDPTSVAGDGMMGAIEHSNGIGCVLDGIEGSPGSRYGSDPVTDARLRRAHMNIQRAYHHLNLPSSVSPRTQALLNAAMAKVHSRTATSRLNHIAGDAMAYYSNDIPPELQENDSPSADILMGLPAYTLTRKGLPAHVVKRRFLAALENMTPKVRRRVLTRLNQLAHARVSGGLTTPSLIGQQPTLIGDWPNANPEGVHGPMYPVRYPAINGNALRAVSIGCSQVAGPLTP